MIQLSIQSAVTTTGGRIVSEHHDATGIMIWPATHLFCQYLLLQDDECHLSNQGLALGGKRVLELGCGCGLVGIAAQKSSHRSSVWVSTDMDEYVLSLCRRNFALNDVELETNNNHSTCIVRPLKWGCKDQIEKILDEVRSISSLEPNDIGGKFDACVGADIVYPSTCGKALTDLFDTVKASLVDGGTFYLSFCSRDGPKTPSRLIQAASEAGFAISILPELDQSILTELPPLLDSKLLVMQQCNNAEILNDKLGDANCKVFPGLQSALDRIAELSSDEEWEAPFSGEDEDVDPISADTLTNNNLQLS